MTGNSTQPATAGWYNFKLYRYDPSLPAAIIFAVVFALLTALHLWRLLRYRTLYFTAFTVGGAFELVGYCGRIWSHFNDTAIGGFVMQAILILVAPALFAASIYMILGRLSRTLNAEHHSLIPVKWLTRAFVAADFFSFTLQAGGGGIQSGGTLQMYNIGEKVITVGLFMQIAFFGFFIAATITFHRRLIARPTQAARDNVVPWRRHLVVLYTVCTLILVRSVVRVVEYLQGNAGYVISHEAFLYVFDAVLMASVMTIMLIWYVDGLVWTEAAAERAKSASSGSEYLMQEAPGPRRETA